MEFKHYNQQQTILLPYSFDDLIPEQHAVRVVDQIVESINIQPLLKAYSKKKEILVITQRYCSKQCCMLI